jgi:diguanylate cyclase (GGDEF)-like protein
LLFEKKSMNFSLLARHHTLFSVVAACLLLSVGLSFGLGELKSEQEISWLDIFGEGSIASLSMIWLFFILASRPPGPVTTGLVLGLSCFMVSALLDLFDEFVYYQAAAAGLSLIESLPAGVGMMIMSYALLRWHQEQLALNRQLYRREANFREHQKIDHITQLYRADYMRGRIDMQLRTKDGSYFSIMMLDIDNFDAFNRQYGPEEGDRLLREISELILMNLRNTDLACRYAGDRFILLLPDTNLILAEELAQHIRQAISHLAFKPSQQFSPVYHSMTIATEIARAGDVVESIISRVNQRLDTYKQYT